jgi:hypothetical protein
MALLATLAKRRALMKAKSEQDNMCYDLTSPHAMCACVLRLASPFAISPLLLSDCKSTHFSAIIDHSPLSRDDDDDKSTTCSKAGFVTQSIIWRMLHAWWCHMLMTATATGEGEESVCACHSQHSSKQVFTRPHGNSRLTVYFPL